MLDIVVGAVLTVLSYSSLAIVLLMATLAASGIVPATVALGLVLGANLGSGLLGVLLTARNTVTERRLPIGNLVFKVVGALCVIPLLRPVQSLHHAASVHQQVVLFHLAFNVTLALLFLGLTGVAARLLLQMFPSRRARAAQRPQHLDPSALATPSLAISCAAREALHQADVVETMLRGIVPVLRSNDLALAERLRQMDDTVDELYTAIKLYLTQISRDGAVRAREPALDRRGVVHHQHGADRRHHRARAAGHRGQEDPPQPPLLRCRHGRDVPPARAAGRQPAAGA